MSILKQKESFAIVYTNPIAITRLANVFAVIRICFGSEEDSISLSYTQMKTLEGEISYGYQVALQKATYGDQNLIIRTVSGELWKDLIDLSREALEQIRTEFEGFPPGKKFKVYRPPNSKKTIVEIVAQGV